MVTRFLQRSFLALALLLAALGVGAEEFLEPDQAFKLTARSQGAALTLQFEIAPGYYLYREQLRVADAAGVAAAIRLPDGKRKFDETFQKEVEVYRDRLTVEVLQAGAVDEWRVTAQGCADKGLCYPPITVVLKPAAGGAWVIQPTEPDATVFGAARWIDGPPTPAAVSGNPTAGPSDDGLAGLLSGGRWWAVALGFFLAGLGLSFTPCVLPMLPILSSIIVGDSAGQASRRRGLLLAVSYSAGMVLVYTALGVAAGLAGEGLAAYLQKPWVLLSFAGLMVLLSLSMFGAYDLQLPAAWQQRLTESSQGLPGGKALSVFVMGALSALIVGPCVAPPLAGALLYISQSKDVWLGGLALFVMACGMSVPLLLLGASAGSLLPRAGAWMERVKHAFGFGLLAVAIWLAQPALTGWLIQILWGTWLAALACMLWSLVPLQPRPLHWLRGAAAALLAFGAFSQWWGAAVGGTDPLRPLATTTAAGVLGEVAHPKFERVKTEAELNARLANSAGRPIILDFYADWCVSCKEMERLTFAKPEVAAKMQRALLLQVDVTANSADDRALLKRFNLFGPPGILFFDANGQELTGLRVIGYQPPERFIQVLAAAGL
ncbi:protein-disulfide reductase DsbD [Inhella gelatinilytica]|nr:protein-disulfide reductase DsbD [Inhella gelatinilytica]